MPFTPIVFGLLAAALVAVILFPRIALQRFDGDVTYADGALHHFEIADLPQYTFGSQPITAPAQRPRHTVQSLRDETPKESTQTTDAQPPVQNAPDLLLTDQSVTPQRSTLVGFFRNLFSRKPNYDVSEDVQESSRDAQTLVRPLGVDEPLARSSSSVMHRRSRTLRAEETSGTQGAGTTPPDAQTPPAAPPEIPSFVEQTASGAAPASAADGISQFYANARRQRRMNTAQTNNDAAAPDRMAQDRVAQDRAVPPVTQVQAAVENAAAVVQEVSAPPAKHEETPAHREDTPAPPVAASNETTRVADVIPLRTSDAHEFEWTKQAGVTGPLDLARRRRLMRMQGAMKNDKARALLQLIVTEDSELAAEAQRLLGGDAAVV